MPTILDRLLGRTAPEKAIVTGNGGSGAGVLAYANSVPLWSASSSPRRLMRQAQELYHSHPWVHAAENVVSSRAAGVPWHLEDDEGEEVTDESAPELKGIRDLIEKPQANLPPGIKRIFRRPLWQVTLRHEGLCGTSFWYLDQRAGLTGTPAALLYINPARMFAVYDQAGNNIGWRLDADDDGQGGVPIELHEILQFDYDPPDVGAYGIGIVESAGMKAQLSQLADRHESNTFGSGGRLSGIITPKTGETISDESWAAFVRDWRNIGEDPQAAKRAIIAKAPIDYIRTTATPAELSVVEVSKLARDDVTSLWGVPLSQLGIEQPAGLNSGSTKSYDEAVLWQGAIHSRLVPFRETIQFGLLDLIAANGGPSTQLVIDEPEFDDETPQYDRAQKAIDQPLTENERRAILGLDPWPDYDNKGEPLGLAVYRPGTLSIVSQAPDEAGKFGTLPEPPPPPPNPFAPPVDPPVDEEELPTKAKLDRRTVGRFEPEIKRAVQSVLDDQKAEVVTRFRRNGARIARKPADKTAWWSDATADEKLRQALAPIAAKLATTVAGRTKQLMARPAKADTFADTVADQVLKSVGLRISGINATTRDDIARLISQGFDDGLAPGDVADLIQGATTFNEARAEMIARTESALVYNESALRSFTEFGVDEVEAIDGDDDAECAARNGQVYPLAEALSITDHPNGTLDWSPVVKAVIEPDPMVTYAKALTEYAMRPAPPAPIVNVSSPDVHVAPAVVNYHPPSISVSAPEVQVDVHVPPQRTVTKTVAYHEDGKVKAVTETPDGA